MKKKIIGFAVLVMFVLGISSMPAQAKTKQVTLYVGDTVRLQEKGDVKWSSEDSMIAKVSKKGKVTAIKEGRVNIVAQKGERKNTYKIVVKNSYYKADFKKAKKIIVRNLTNGKARKLTRNDKKMLQKRVNQCNFYKKMKDKKESASGDRSYSFSFYDEKGKLFLQLSFGKKAMTVQKYTKKNTYISEYVSEQEIVLDEFREKK